MSLLLTYSRAGRTIRDQADILEGKGISPKLYECTDAFSDGTANRIERVLDACVSDCGSRNKPENVLSPSKSEHGSIRL